MQNLFDLLQRRSWLGPLILVLTLLIGLALGLLVGWVVFPVSWTLSADDIQAIADSYALNNDLALAVARLSSLSAADQGRLFRRVIADSASRNRTIEAERATGLAQALRIPLDASNPTPSTGSSSSPLLPLLLGGGILVAALVVAVVGFVIIRRVIPAMRARRSGAVEMEIGAVEPSPQEPAARVAAPAPSGSGILGRFQASYTAGVDNFDASFPLETQRQGFLGECGIGVSETVGDGLPDKVTAFDLWLFDKTDVRTVTQILMSDYAFSDPSVRAKLQTKGDAVRATKDQTMALETQSLRIEGRILELVYATNPALPPNSYFQKLVIEIVASLK